MSRRTPISKAELLRRGWVRVDPRPWSKTAARYAHARGWAIAHSGHATDMHPFLLWDPQGRLVLTGALHAEPPRPDYGTAWWTLEQATGYVLTLRGRELEQGPDRHPDELPRLLEREREGYRKGRRRGPPRADS